jgi:hypothetical protein
MTAREPPQQSGVERRNAERRQGVFAEARGQCSGECAIELALAKQSLESRPSAFAARDSRPLRRGFGIGR